MKAVTQKDYLPSKEDLSKYSQSYTFLSSDSARCFKYLAGHFSRIWDLQAVLRRPMQSVLKSMCLVNQSDYKYLLYKAASSLSRTL